MRVAHARSKCVSLFLFNALTYVSWIFIVSVTTMSERMRLCPLSLSYLYLKFKLQQCWYWYSIPFVYEYVRAYTKFADNTYKRSTTGSQMALARAVFFYVLLLHASLQMMGEPALSPPWCFYRELRDFFCFKSCNLWRHEFIILF